MTCIPSPWVKRLLPFIGGMSFLFILGSSVIPAGREIQTDFSNYYIPARLLYQGRPVTHLYDFSWFQRQMMAAGIDETAGGFNNFPPPAGLVLAPFGWLEPLAAKQAWTAVNLAALIALLLLLERLAGLPFSLGLALAALSGLALRNNFLFGQFYIILAALIVGALLLLRSGRERSAGALLGVATAIKLYPAPFLLYFALRGQWRAVLGFLEALCLAYGISVLAFGWENTAFFLTHILPRSVLGLTDNPFHPGLQSWSSFLRQLLVYEPTLNPDPWLHSAWGYYFLRDGLLFGLLGALAFVLRERSDSEKLSILVLGLLLLSPTVHSYHGLLALIAVACWLPRLWQERKPAIAAAVLALFVLAFSPVVYWWPDGYLRMWMLFGLMGLLLWQTRPIRLPRLAVAVVLILAALHATWATRPVTTDTAVPVAWEGARAESPAAASGLLVYSSLASERYALAGDVPDGAAMAGNTFSPAFARDGAALFFEAAQAGQSRVVELQDGAREEWTPPRLQCVRPSPSADGTRVAALCSGRLYLFEAPGLGYPIEMIEGEVTDPALSPDGTRLAFSLRESGRWHLFELELSEESLRPLTTGEGSERGPRYAPDGQSLAFSRRIHGGWDLWLRDLRTGREWRLTRHSVNDTQPAWGPDGRSLYFASDRGRGVFMPAIYRLDLGGEI